MSIDAKDTTWSGPGARTEGIEHRFKEGERVRVRLSSTGANPRTPTYLRGKTGVIAELHGATYAPHDHRGVYPYLYTVAFDVSEVSGKSTKDKILVDLTEEWLEPV
jgi:hypothetical protein